MALTLSEYDRAVRAIEAVSWRGVRPGLERTLALLEVLGNPHAGLRGVLVAGTNGKGSVCAIVDSITRAAGLRTVLLTKPHLTSFCERIAVDGAPLREDAFAQLIDDVTEAARQLPEALQPTGFELVTVAGILAARRARCDVLVCEVGMGGRLDSTNVLDLGVCALTNVALDHREHLGDTVPEIAHEKAAIVKRGDVAVTTADEPALSVLRARCEDVGAPLVDARTRGRLIASGRDGVRVETQFHDETLLLHVPLLGAFQVRNVLCATAAAEALAASGLPLDARAVRDGCARVRWRARMQWIDGAPPIVVDAAHNPAGVAAALAALDEVRDGADVVALVAAMRDKDVAGMMAPLEHGGGIRAVVTTAPSVQRAMPAAELAWLVRLPCRSVEGVAAALDVARDMAGPQGLVLVCGSLYLAGEVLALLGA